MSGIVESVGHIGLQQRSDRRTVNIVERCVTSPNEVRRLGLQTIRAGRLHGDTRLQLKFPGDVDLAHQPGLAPFVEGYLRPNGCSQGVVFMGHNRGERRRNITSDWDLVREVWKSPLRLTPYERMQRLQQNGHTLTRHLSEADVPDLTEIWRPFGWTQRGTEAFIASHNAGEAGWFVGVRDENGVLCSGAKAEALRLQSIEMRESTEWGTKHEHRGKGLATLAAIGLNCLMLSDPPVSGTQIIFAEANMDPRKPGHRVARDAGFATLADLHSDKANHVLPQHVAVDGQLSNFLITQLTQHAIHQYYPDEMMELADSLIH